MDFGCRISDYGLVRAPGRNSRNVSRPPEIRNPTSEILSSHSNQTKECLLPLHLKNFLRFAIAPPGIPAEVFVGSRDDVHREAIGKLAKVAASPARVIIAGHKQEAVGPQTAQFRYQQLRLLRRGSRVMGHFDEKLF